MTYTFTYGQTVDSSLIGANIDTFCRVLSHVHAGRSTTTALNLDGVGQLCASIGYTAEVFVDALDSIFNDEDRVRTRDAGRHAYREWLRLAQAASGRGLFQNGCNGPSDGRRLLTYCGVTLTPSLPSHVRELVVNDYAVRTLSTSTIVRLAVDVPEGAEATAILLTQEGLVYVTYGLRVVWCGSATSSGPSTRNPMTFDRRFPSPPRDYLARVTAAIATIFEDHAVIRALRTYADAHNGRGYLCGRPLPTPLALRAGIRAADFRSTFYGCAFDGFAGTARRLTRSMLRAPSATRPTRQRWSWDRIPEDVARIMAADLTLSIDEPEAR